MNVALIQRIHNRGLPATQADLIAEMQHWFADQSDGTEMPDIIATVADAMQGALVAVVGFGNSATGVFQGAFDAVKAIWSALPSAIGDFAFDAKGFDVAQSSRPCLKVTIPGTGGRDGHDIQTGTLHVDRDGNVVGFVCINADDDLVHVSPLAKMSPGIDQKGQDCEGTRPSGSYEVTSRSARRGNLMVDKSTQ